MSFSVLIDLEKKLENKSIRSSREDLENLMDENFKEVISNGELWDREKVINALIETAHLNNYNTFDFEVIELTKDVGMVVFKTKNEDGSIVTQRSSTWRWNGDSWKQMFHQATRIG
jgi:hypothetical protein